MKDYIQFVDQLKHHLSIPEKKNSSKWKLKAGSFVDGLASEELRRLVDLETRRQYGAFFTSSETAKALLSEAQMDYSGSCIFYDPAVGAGNLLIAARNAAAKTASQVTLLGTDLHEEFIAAASLRHQINEALNDDQVNCNIELDVADGLQDNEFYRRATHIVTNPPFHQLTADKEVDWAIGKVSAAALFIDKTINFITPGTVILAILPDVLRSGSRYERWRKMVEHKCSIQNISMLGQFDKHTDIDVFSLLLIKRTIYDKSPNLSWKPDVENRTCIADSFNVSVGNVVDNRDLQEGPELPFLVSRGLESWKEINTVNRLRKFKGRSIDSPFLVIKRTSRMGDKYRAAATIINVHSPVYVDNHLIVVCPKTGKLSDCKKLLKKLQSEQVNDWINQQIRCRHLTVKVVSKIPI